MSRRTSGLNGQPCQAFSELPCHHLGWAFHGRSEFEARVTWFLADGVAQGQRLLLVTDAPTVRAWPEELIETGQLKLTSTADSYDRIDPPLLCESFGRELAAALSDGYQGLRVAADNSSMLREPIRFRQWLAWERVAGEFLADRPILGLCAFDADTVPAKALATVLRLHWPWPVQRHGQPVWTESQD